MSMTTSMGTPMEMPPSRGVRVREAVAEDAAVLVEMVCEEAREAEGRVPGEEVVRGAVEAALRDPSLARYWVAEVEGEAGGPRAVGAIAVVREWSDWNNAAYWWIQFVYVVPEERGGAVVRALVEHVRAEAQRAGAPEVRLYVHGENARAIRAYEKLGFARLPYVAMTLRL
jgi:ribosomal protein S18 acetylase RimI-like enzyme